MGVCLDQGEHATGKSEPVTSSGRSSRILWVSEGWTVGG